VSNSYAHSEISVHWLTPNGNTMKSKEAQLFLRWPIVLLACSDTFAVACIV